MTVTPNGFVKKNYAEILEELKLAILDIDDTAKFTPKSVYGNLIATASNTLSDLWNLAELVYAQRNVENAYGTGLDDLCMLLNLRRFVAKYSYIYDVVFTGTVGVTIPAGFQVKSTFDGTIWITENSYTIGSGGTATGVLKSISRGPFEADPNTVTSPVTNIRNLTSVTHAEPATVGRNRETDEELQTRRTTAYVMANGSVVKGILRALYDLNFDEGKAQLTYIDVIPNRDQVSDSRGRPAHSVECIVEYEGSYNEARETEIAQAIWDAVGGGGYIYGEETPIEVVDHRGRVAWSTFTKPVQEEIYVKLAVDVTEALTSSEIEQLKAAVVARGNQLTIGQDVVVIGPNGLSTAVSNLGIDKIESVAMYVGLTSTPTGTRVVIGDGVDATPERAVFSVTRVEVV